MKTTKQGGKINKNDDVCILCENETGVKKTTKPAINNVTDFWNSMSHKQKLQLLSVDKNFVLKQIRSSNLYSPNLTNSSNSGDSSGKAGIGFSKQMCLCPACKKRKAIFNAVVKGIVILT
jgi:hypothetical protein